METSAADVVFGDRITFTTEDTEEMWKVVKEACTGIVNVIPVDDLNEHHPSPFCPCAPLWNKDAVVVHNAFDGRVLLESDWEGDVQVLRSDDN